MFAFFERLVRPYPDAIPPVPPRGLARFIWACSDGLRGHVAAMAALTALIGVFEAILFGFMGRIVDWLAEVPPAQLWAQRGDELLALAGVLVGSTVLVAAQALLKYQALNGNFPMRLRWNFHRQMLAQSLAFFQDEFAGRVATKVMQTALAVRDVVMLLTDILVFIIIYFATMLTLVGSFDTTLLWPFGIWLLCYLAALRWFVPRLAKVGQVQADARSLMTGRITDAYTNITTVKLFSHAQRESGYARSAMHEFMGTVHQQMRMVTALELVIHALSVGLVLGTTGSALWLWSQGQVGVGAVAAATAMALRLNGISHWIMWEMASLFENIGTVQDGLNTLTRAPTVVDRADAKPLQVPHGEVVFDHLVFGYGASKRVIDDLSLTIRPGEKIGLVGRSGAGKSTLVNLLLRFHDLAGGRILVDGQDIAQVSQESLRAQVGMVTQDTSLLHRSVRDNLLYGRPDADDAAMIAAARRAEAHEFIQGLTDPKGRSGYDAHVGERGVKLSGGQRQRIAIARVMLKDAPILLLDEATSALDSEVEAAIQDSLYRLMEGKTVVAIAHRLSTIAAMDRLVVMDAGRIVEQGTHAELLAAGGLYARLWAHQSGGFLGEE
ncbi:ABC transporter ATP-binding protein [Ideonella sp. 4Y16]|uniref:ABC transporter ATP-binding protein n=1 Tax=Ideonella alba TaxID=2824118 RepID=A0A941BNJ8_9BURK|nr:ABC transporter ATP-binding protein [Ideonella alba]MBQ0933409.1 ABC transporter ATP-binding protein [Ideonella alba]MBQ0943546.1 ABC transporter ATP-binding protein [Ideonella alba]